MAGASESDSSFRRAAPVGGGVMTMQASPIGTSMARFAMEPEDEPLRLVTVVIPCHNQAHFLSEAIESVLGQSYPCREVIVVDDGSTDDTGAVAARFPEVRTIVQTRQGLAAARNEGLRHAGGDYVVFLDADDRLLPRALEIGARRLGEDPEAAFVSGGHVRVTADGTLLEQPEQNPVQQDHYLALLSGNYIGMHAAVMYRREALEAVGGFDRSLARCEDYDLYLRVARRFRVLSHEEPVAEYRLHDANMSRDTAAMLTSVLGVLRTEVRRVTLDEAGRRAYRAGLAAWRDYYGRDLLRDVQAAVHGRMAFRRALRSAGALVRQAPLWLARRVLRRIRRLAKKEARRLVRVLPFLRRRRPGIGRIRWGDLRGLEPVSRRFGYDRGLPIDRHYIERFLCERAGDIRGRVLEIGDRSYTTRFGGERVTRSDVLHVTAGNPDATLIGDLTHADHIPPDSFDAVVLTQTLHLIYDVGSAVRTLHRILKPGGVLLATVPGISQLEDGEWARTWYWSFTALSASRLFSEAFSDVEVRTRGNVLASTAFLQGIAAEELGQEELEHEDPLYPLLITIRAVKQGESK
jgi:glycosyltransferase involved in cell wall biosynthesis